MSPKHHELKTWPKYFEKVLTGQKKFEIRLNDRDFRVGDILILREFIPGPPPSISGKYTGRVINKRVTYILRGTFGIAADYVCMSIDDPQREQ